VAGLKLCPRCQVAPRDGQSHCKPCRREYRKEWRKRFPEKAHRGDRRSNLGKYKMKPAEWEAMFEEQGRACAICRATEPRGQGWHTDHSHVSGAVRGILCHDCNVALGYYERTILPNFVAFDAWRRKL
jgi:hypothetical protein